MKIGMIGVSAETIKRFSLYSHETAREIADCISRVMGADIGVCIRGIEGPLGVNARDAYGNCLCCGQRWR